MRSPAEWLRQVGGRLSCLGRATISLLMEAFWEKDEVPEVWPLQECSSSVEQQEVTAHISEDSSVNRIVVRNDDQRDGLKVVKTFLERVSDPRPEMPRRCASNYGDYQPQWPKDGKLTFPGFRRQTLTESFKAKWEHSLNLHNGSQILACPEPGLTHHPMGNCKQWSETARKKWCQASQHATNLEAKGSCCYCRHKSIDRVYQNYKGFEQFILDQFGLEATLHMDWSDSASLPQLIGDEIFNELPKQCPHWELSCPEATCPPGTFQCHHYLHGRCQKAHCSLCHCGEPTCPHRYEWQTERNQQGRAFEVHRNAHHLWATSVSTWCPTLWSW